MKSDPTSGARSPSEFGRWAFPTVDVDYDPEAQALWMSYNHNATPHMSSEILRDVSAVRASVRALFASPQIADHPIRYFLLASKKPGVFNLGGDLEMFVDVINRQDRDTLWVYARACVDLVHSLSVAFDLPMVTLSVVEGQALGGGFEGALAEDFVVTEEDVRIGMPEIAFNTFPGMGAISLLSRRLGVARAEDLISSGKIYTGREMFEMGAIDILAPNGKARETATAWMMEGGQGQFERRLALTRARRQFFPIAAQELESITDLWVDTCLAATPADIRHMERLTAAQRRMMRKDSNPF